MEKIKYKDVDEYIYLSDEYARHILIELRRMIKSVAPEVEEKISYNVPFYKYYGEFVGFATYKNHISFGFGNDILNDEERNTLLEKGYKLGKGTLQIRFDQEIPEKEVKKILQLKAEANKKMAQKK